MRVNEALGQIAQIHDHLARAEVYRGFNPLGVALSGVVGLAAAAVQPLAVAPDDPVAFVWFWLAVAVVAGAVGVSPALDGYLRREDEFARRKTRRVLGQFVPCVAAGLAVTFALSRTGAGFVPYLPGLWAVLFALGVFAARPYLPHATGWVGLFYLAAGALLLAVGPADLGPAGRAFGGVFAAGQLATAGVLSRNRERDDNG